MSITILLTSVGNDGFISVWKALTKNRYDFQLFGADADVNAYGLQLTEKSFIIPKRSSEQDLLSALKKIILEHQIQIIYPLSTEDQSFYSHHILFFQTLHCRIIVSSEDAVIRCNNKHLLYDFLKDSCFPLPKYEIAHNKDELIGTLNRFDYENKPVVLKKPFSTGAQGVKIVMPFLKNSEHFFLRDNNPITINQLKEWIEHLEHWENIMISEYLPGLHISADVFLKDGKAEICTLRTEERHLYGMATFGKTIKDDFLAKLAMNLAEYIGLNYTVNLEFKLDEQNIPKLMEINPRIPASIDHTIKSGCNMPLWNVLSILNKKINIKTSKENVIFWRCWDTIFYDKETS